MHLFGVRGDAVRLDAAARQPNAELRRAARSPAASRCRAVRDSGTRRLKGDTGSLRVVGRAPILSVSVTMREAEDGNSAGLLQASRPPSAVSLILRTWCVPSPVPAAAVWCRHQHAVPHPSLSAPGRPRPLAQLDLDLPAQGRSRCRNSPLAARHGRAATAGRAASVTPVPARGPA